MYYPEYDQPISPLLLTDFYKICHKSFYNPETKKLVSYWTPRKSRLEGIDSVVMFGLQAYIKKYLIDYFNLHFFDKQWFDIQDEYMDVIGSSLSPEIAAKELEAFHELHKLGYLPIEIRAVPEGTIVPIGCPMIQFENTDPRFFWLINYLETLSSCNLWFSSTAATIANTSRQIVDEWYDKTVEDSVPRSGAAGDFSMRGMTSVESSMMGDAGHLLSFSSTATVPTLWWLHNFYNAPFNVARGTPSTEHSVMESYTPESEFEAYRHLIEDVMPNGVLSMVSDTWNLWTVLTDYLPRLKDSIMARDGKIVIRPDSGNPVDIICGENIPVADIDLEDAREYLWKKASKNYRSFQNEQFSLAERVGDKIVKETFCWFDSHLRTTDFEVRDILPEEKGVAELLWDVFGGTVNSKGYKVLDKHIGMIYGDAITHTSAREMFARLAAKGFAANNIVLGFGSYTYQYNTRDTFGFALKVTNGVLGDKEVPMFKDPITDKGKNGAGKKSQKGMCIVVKGEDGQLTYTDGHTEQETLEAEDNLLQPVFLNGELLRDEDFDTIRNRLHPNF